MRNKTKMYLIIAIVSIIVLLGSLIVFNIFQKRKLENELIKLSTQYFDNELSKLLPGGLKRYGEFNVSLRILKNVGKDIQTFENKDCDLEETYVTFKYDKSSKYTYEVHMKC